MRISILQRLWRSDTIRKLPSHDDRRKLGPRKKLGVIRSCNLLIGRRRDSVKHVSVLRGHRRRRRTKRRCLQAGTLGRFGRWGGLCDDREMATSYMIVNALLTFVVCHQPWTSCHGRETICWGHFEVILARSIERVRTFYNARNVDGL